MLPEVRLDTDSFKALIEEYRMQIAGIFPEWTNYNYSDPGMTFVELFAWMKENQQFFMEQLSPEHYMSFCRLMGIRQQKKRPAVVAAIMDRYENARDTIIPRGTVYHADGIPYTTIKDRYIPAARICGVRAGAFSADEERVLQGVVNLYPFGRKAAIGENMEIYLNAPLPVGRSCHLIVILRQEPQRNLIGDFPFEMLSELSIEYFTADGWKEIEDIADSTKGLLFSGYIDITIPEPMEKIENDRYVIRITLKDGQYDRAPFVTNMGFQGILLKQYEEAECCRIPGGIPVGEGNGFPSQRISLPYAGIMCDSVEISVEDILNPGVMKPWRRVEDFSKEGPESECFIVNENTGEAVFGDGKRGLPPEGKIMLERATVTRSFAGTAMEGTLLSAPGQPDLHILRTVAVGKDAETEEELKCRMKLVKANTSLSTSEDYEEQVSRTPGLVISCCKVLESLSTPTKVTIAVRPGDGKELLKLSPAMERNIYNHINCHRLIGTDIKLMSPEYIRVRTELHVIPSDHYTDIENKVRDAVRKYFAEYGSFGDSIVYGRLYGMIDSLDCVERVYSLTFDADKVSVIKNKSGDLIPPANGLFICGDIRLEF